MDDASSAPLGPGAWRSRPVNLVVLGYFALECWLCFALNVWRDEMYSLHSTSGSLWFAFRSALDFELQPPLYFVTLALFRSIDSSIVFARLLSTLLVCAAIWGTAALSERLFPKLHPVWMAAVFATHPLAVWAGTEIRVYAMVILMSVLVTIAFFDAHFAKKPEPRSRVLFAGLSVLAVYTQYYLGVLLVSFGVVVLLERDRKALRRYVTDAAAAGVLVLPLLFAARSQVGSHRDDFGAPLSLGGSAIRTVVTRFESYLFSFNKAIDESVWSNSVVRVARWAYRVVLVSVLGGVLWRSGVRKLDYGALERRWPLFVIVGTYAACMFVLMRIAGPLGVGERHTIGILVPSLVAALALPMFLIGRQAGAFAAGFLIASNVPATLLSEVVTSAKDCDCRRIAKFIESQERQDEPILVFPAEDTMPLSVYYQGINRLVAVPRPPRLDLWDQRLFVLKDPHEVANLIGGDRVRGLWVHTNTYGTDWGQQNLEEFLSAGYTQDEDREFYRHMRLRHFVPSGASGAQSATSR